jgi:hypothetical protein
VSYDGQVIVTRWYCGDDASAHIDRADPSVKVDESVIAEARTGTSWLTLDEGNRTLTIRDDFGQQYIYRLDWYDAERHYWGASWPD